MRYVICTFGSHYLGMTLVCVWSILKVDRDAEIHLFWQDCDSDSIEDICSLAQAPAAVHQHRTAFAIDGDLTRRISSKVALWNYAMQRMHERGSRPTVFMDNDLLVRRSVTVAFESMEGDLGVTVKPGPWPLNSGIVFSTCSTAAREFFSRWFCRTSEILASPTDLKRAASRSEPFGGADQMALYELIGLDSTVPVPRPGLQLVSALPCHEFNETTSRPLRDDSPRVIHYKGGWHPILMEGAAYTSKRPARDSLDMHVLFLRHFQEAKAVLPRAKDSSARDWRIVVPSYLDLSGARIRRSVLIRQSALDYRRKIGRRLRKGVGSALAR